MPDLRLTTGARQPKTRTTFSIRADSKRQPPPHPALHPDAPSALCAQTDPEVFFPEPGGSTDAAVTICSGCELWASCYEWALTIPDLIGVWGGSTERQREKERGRRARHNTPPADTPARERRAA